MKAAHSISSKKKRDNKNDLNVGNEIIDQIVTEKEPPQAYGPWILENLASAVTRFWQTEARNEQKLKNWRMNIWLLRIAQSPYTEWRNN